MNYSDPETEQSTEQLVEKEEVSLKMLVNTPLKKIMFGLQLLSYVFIVASPAIGAFIGRLLELTKGQTAGVILGVFIAGEVFFYGSLLFLGKEIVQLLRKKLKGVFRKKD
jgi:mannitol-specific phosphotransferase system IIBC component